MSLDQNARSCYPKLEISLAKIRHNTDVIVRMCQETGIRVAGVTKGFCGSAKIAGAMVEGGIDTLADSRMENLKRLSSFRLPKLLLRLPMISQADEVVEYADISLNSEIETICALSKAACKKKKLHQVILMFDLGDLREGIFDTEEMFHVVEATMKLERISLIGIGTNLTCYGGVIPTKENLMKLVEIKKSIESDFGITLRITSGGNSSSLYLVEKQTMPVGINQLRLGESIILGRETAYGNQIAGTDGDCFRFIAEIIEVKRKPSIPNGEVGLDAFGNRPNFLDRGIRRRAICAVGKQDILPQNMIPEDKDIIIVAASSDHLILDITECHKTYFTGSLVSFHLNYGGILSSMTSEYVSKSFI